MQDEDRSNCTLADVTSGKRLLSAPSEAGAMSGRIIVVQFRRDFREVVYQTRDSDPESLTWRFVKLQPEVPTKAERAVISAMCLQDLRHRRAEWRAQILRRRIVPGLRRIRWL